MEKRRRISPAMTGGAGNGKARQPLPWPDMADRPPQPLQDGGSRLAQDEIGLIHAARRGEVEAFNQLVLTYQDLVYNQAFRLLDDSQAADDATQEAFIAAYRSLASYRGGSFRAWLSRIVTNLCYDEFRRRRAFPTTPFDAWDIQGEEIESPGWSKDGAETPEEWVMRAETSQSIQRSLNSLPPDHRNVLVLVDLLGYEYAEAAKALGKPVGTVKSRLARARAQLRGALLAAQP
jgi:RNA polymerase sigma-70 factor (ECF subfamily)